MSTEASQENGLKTKDDVGLEYEDTRQEFPEVNPDIYKDVDPLLFRGFLHISATINDVPFVFKSLNHHEFEILKFMAPTEDATKKTVNRFYHHFLAYGVLMVDGINVLSDRESNFVEVVKFFEEFDTSVITRIVRYLSELNRRANRAVLLTEAYAMESVSRLRWAQFAGMDLTSTSVTGLSGTSSLGLNWAQLTWIAINRFEDIKEASEREWENAKFIASAMAGKGMTKVHNQDRRRRKSEMKDKIERRDKILRMAVLGESADKINTNQRVVMAARSVGELAQQLKNDLSGEKDWHDRVFESYEARRQQAEQEREQQLIELQKANDEYFGEGSDLIGDTMIGLTPEEVKARMLKQQQRKFLTLNSEDENEEKFRRVTEKLNSVQRPVTQSSSEEVPFIQTSTRTPGVPFGTKK